MEVAIITSVPKETDAYTLDPRVTRIQLTPGVSLTPRLGFPWSVRALRRQIRSLGHTLVISFIGSLQYSGAPGHPGHEPEGHCGRAH